MSIIKLFIYKEGGDRVKKTYRKNILASLKDLSQVSLKKQNKEDNILKQLYQSPEWQESQVIGVTLAMPIEFDTSRLIKEAIKSGKTICVPKTFGKGLMDFHFYDETIDMFQTSFGVYEPVDSQKFDKSEIDLLIVPGVGFTKEGYRIGFGGGFYDRYLADYEGKTCSLVFDEQLLNEFTADKYDLPVDTLFTYQEEGPL